MYPSLAPAPTFLIQGWLFEWGVAGLQRGGSAGPLAALRAEFNGDLERRPGEKLRGLTTCRRWLTGRAP
jgi:hypothetical protein